MTQAPTPIPAEGPIITPLNTAASVDGVPLSQGGSGVHALRLSARSDVLNRIADLITAHPGMRPAQIAHELQIGVPTIRRILTSDLFAEVLARTQARVVDPLTKERLEQDFQICLTTCLETITAAAEQGSLEAAIEGAKIASAGAGFGAKATPVPALAQQLVFNIPPTAPTTQAWLDNAAPKPAA